MADGGYQAFAEIIANHARRHPAKVAVHSIAERRQMTYGELSEVTNRIASALRARGIGAGDRVLVLAGNSLAMIQAYLGILRHGATVCTVNAETNAAHLAEIAAAVSPRLTLFENALDLCGAALPVDDFVDGLRD